MEEGVREEERGREEDTAEEANKPGPHNPDGYRLKGTVRPKMKSQLLFLSLSYSSDDVCNHQTKACKLPECYSAH